MEEVKAIADRYHLPVEEVEAKYKEYLQAKGNPEQARKATDYYFKRIVGRVDLQEYKGIIIGADRVRDRFELMRKKALKIKEEDFDRAIAEGYIDTAGNVLDYRKTVFGRENKNYGKPLLGSLLERDIYLIAGTDSEDWKLSRATLTGELIDKVEVKELFRPVKFLANRRQKGGFGLVSLTKFQPIDIQVDIESLLERHLGVFWMHEVEQYLTGRQDSDRFEVIAVKGDVLTVAPDADTPYIDITTEQTPSYLRCFLRNTINLDKVQEEQLVYCIGTLNTGRGKGPVMTVFGLYVP